MISGNGELDTNATLYNEQGYRHRICHNGHHWKDQEFGSLTEFCPVCGELEKASTYYEYNEYSQPYPNEGLETDIDDDDEGNRYLEA